MKYVKGNCPVCGSIDIKEINVEYDNQGNNVAHYVCLSCGEYFAAKPKQINKNNQKNRFSEENLYEHCIKSVVELRVIVGEKAYAGTGFFISEKYLLTNAHVVKPDDCPNKSPIIIGNYYKDKSKGLNFNIICLDEKNDIALLELIGTAENVVNMTEDINLGESVFAIGNAKGYGLCIADGVISDISRIIGGCEYLMTSAIVTNGNSGGPIFNKNGEFIGMVTIGSAEDVAMNYAIPTKRIIKFLNILEEKENIKIL